MTDNNDSGHAAKRPGLILLAMAGHNPYLDHLEGLVVAAAPIPLSDEMRRHYLTAYRREVHSLSMCTVARTELTHGGEKVHYERVFLVNHMLSVIVGVDAPRAAVFETASRSSFNVHCASRMIWLPNEEERDEDYTAVEAGLQWLSAAKQVPRRDDSLRCDRIDVYSRPEICPRAPVAGQEAPPFVSATVYHLKGPDGLLSAVELRTGGGLLQTHPDLAWPEGGTPDPVPVFCSGFEPAKDDPLYQMIELALGAPGMLVTEIHAV